MVAVGLPDVAAFLPVLGALCLVGCCCSCVLCCICGRRLLRVLVRACRKPWVAGVSAAAFALCAATVHEDFVEYFYWDPFDPAKLPEPADQGSVDFAAPAAHAGFLRFPADFTWGAATAAYQIEGAAAEGGRKPSIWDDITHWETTKGLFQTGDVADDHYHRFRDDVRLMAHLGLKAYRMSISWSRLIPDGEGEVNEEGARFYSDLFDALLENGIEPWVTLYHWDLPSALNDEYGGWLGPKSRIVTAFGKYARVCFERFGDRVKHWMTLNEPFVMAFYYAPGFGFPKKDKGGSVDPYTAAHNMILSHGEAVRIFRAEFAAQRGKIGLALNSDFAVPHNRSSPRELAAVQRQRDFQIGWFADPVYFGDYPASMRDSVGSRLPKFTAEESALLKNSTDFFGINNYFSTHAFGAPQSALGRALWKWFSRWYTLEGAYYADREVRLMDDPAWERVTTGTGWTIVPWGFRDLLLYVQERYQPRGGIAVTESGTSHSEDDLAESDKIPGAIEPQPYNPASPPKEDWDSETLDDPRRVRWYKAHLTALHAARARGADVRAYFGWSLMDNFEWLAGYKMRFGMIHVDYRTQKRTVKSSGRFIARAIKESGFEAPPRAEQYSGRPW